MTDLAAQLIETWQIHNRINLYLLNAVAPNALVAVPTPKGRNVGEQFAHIQNVRLMWLQPAAPDLMAGLVKLEKEAVLDKDGLRQALDASGWAIAALLQRSIEAGSKVKGFKPHVSAFLGYFIAHESAHREGISLTLTQTGHKLDQKVAYGLWEWGTR